MIYDYLLNKMSTFILTYQKNQFKKRLFDYEQTEEYTVFTVFLFVLENKI